ncbi:MULTISPECIES: MBL fold metallo-hydrolase [unclassified Nostoc]|uniref:MBL fold metallo-hydrolase n=1 Tax=unclassified Nostoc TaxID=2593658 RepID=UPI002636C8AE|nr:MBL fold metallo-hydrolase [Nostoc sp. S13]MDF5737194.1 MBL fold metallo-hydrolase [Nostoc sp. S13]
MEIQMIGHASIFVETQDCKILMDPVLWSPYCQGIEDVFPKREVIHELLPEFDLLIISHWHSDHFDIRSLANLPKTVDVLIPQDKKLKTYLTELGYSHIYTLGDFSEVKIGSTNILTTRSENRVPEYGIVFADPSGVFWNQVDSHASLDTIRFVKSRYPQVDFLLAPWETMLETKYQYNKSLSFPYSAYNKRLGNIGVIQPKAISPGSCGFQKINGSSWLNQILFPVTREQFCKDVKMVCPEIGENVFPLDPGDILIFKNSEFSYTKEMCKFVKKLEDEREILDFSPVNIEGKLIDDNPDNYNLSDMREAIEQEVYFNLPNFILENKNSLFLEHCRWNVIYQLEIVFPDSSRKWSFDFSEQNIRPQSGRNPFANLFTIITASSFYSLLKQVKAWEYISLSGYHRGFKKIYIPTPHGIIQPADEEIIDPIQLRFPLQEIFESIQHREVEKWKQLNGSTSILNEKKTFMMKIGNTLVRLGK